MGAMRTFFGGLTWLLLFIILALPLGILHLWKFLVVILSWKKRIRLANSEHEVTLFPLSSGDSILATNSSWKKSIVNFGFLLRFEENATFTVEALRDHFRRTFLDKNSEGGSYEKLFSFLIPRGGHVFRATGINTLNLEEHIKEIALNEDGTVKSSTLETFIVEWLLTPYKENKPCWEIILISQNNTELTCRKAMAFKIHHALADGYSILHILDKLTNNTSPYLVKDFKESTFSQLQQLLEAPLNLSKLGGMPPEKNPFQVQPTSRYEWIISFTIFPLDDLKQLRRKYNVRVASIILTIITGALREFLIEEDRKESIPERFPVANTLPWPRHPARKEGSSNRDKLCNHWVAAIVNVPLKENDPIKRLKKIDSELELFQSLGLDKFMKRVMLPIFGCIPYPVLERLLTTNDPGMGAGLTSLIGGDDYSLLGCKVVGINPFLAIHDNNPFVPLSFFTFSHTGKLELTIGANPSTVFKDRLTLDRICHLCHNEFNKIKGINENYL